MIEREEGERKNQKSAWREGGGGEQEEGKCCTSLLISLRKMIEGIGMVGGVEGVWVKGVGWCAVALGKQAGE